MFRPALVSNVTAMFQDAGFIVDDRVAVRPKSFDFAARRGEDLLLLRILGNIDTFDGVTDSEIRHLGSHLGTTPLIVGFRTRDEDLRPGVICFRRGVSVLNPGTAMDLFVEEISPLIYAAPDGLYVSLNGDVLAEEWQEHERSLGRLAAEFDILQRTVSKYENGMNMSIEVAIHLEELFDRPFLNPVDAFTGVENVCDIEPTPDDPDVNPDDGHAPLVLTRIGFIIHPTVHAPFRAVSKDTGWKRETNILTGYSPFTRSAEEHAQIISSLDEITRTRSVYFVEEQQKRESVNGTGIVGCEELAIIDDPDEIRDLIRERTRNPVES